MKRFVLVILAAAVTFNAGATSQQPDPAAGTVVLISLDGFPATALADPMVPVPTLRRLAAAGAAATAMTVVNPAVTWPNHTTMVTGVAPAKHGVLFNGMLMRGGPKGAPRVEPWRDKREMVQGDTVYDLAHRAGMGTAQVDWVAIQNPGTITWAFPERPSVDGAVEKEMIAAGVATKADVEGFTKLPITRRDQIWADAATFIIKTHKPRLMLLHFLTLDSTHHRYGPGSLAASGAMAFLDGQVARVIDALKAAGLDSKTTMMIVSDHGFHTTKRLIRANAVLRQAGLIGGDAAALQTDAYVVPEGGTAMVYVTDTQNRERLRPKLVEIFRAAEGVDRVLGEADFAALGLPSPSANPQMADLVLVAKQDYAFAAPADGEAVVPAAAGGAGHHGSLSTEPGMNAIFIASGYRIRPGAQLGQIGSVDIAPTIAALLGLKLGPVDGKALDAIITPPARPR
jgi:predicted AlkP superfamily pyrophosphatase or phosphodiesterase